MAQKKPDDVPTDIKEEEEWDDSGEVEKLSCEEAQKSYEKMWQLFDNIEEKANRMLTRDFVFISLVFTGVGFLINQNLNQIYWAILGIDMFFIASFLSLGIWKSLAVQKVRKFDSLVPSGIIKMSEDVPNVKKFYSFLMNELEKAGESYETICDEKGTKLGEALKYESWAAIAVIGAIFWTIFGYFFLQS